MYCFTATIRSAAAKTDPQQRPIDGHVIGYIPIEEGIEPVPNLLTPPEVTPATPTDKGVPPLPRAPVKPGDPTVGRYVVRNDDPGFVAGVNAFWQGLAAGVGAAPWTDAQYYWAYPFEYTYGSNSFVNSVNVALTKGHGCPWQFTTLDACCDKVYINTTGGYGASAGGVLCYWIIHACEVIPSPDDTANWADPWWNIFNGLRSVVGYRTVAYINDGVELYFGEDLNTQMGFVSTWLLVVHEASAYSGNPTYFGCNGISHPMGRASAIAACGCEDGSVFDLDPVEPATCLTIFWYSD